MRTSKVIFVVLMLGLVLSGIANGKKKNKECRYKRGSWTECNGDTNQRTMTKTLKEGSGANCEQTKTKTKACKVGEPDPTQCKYKRTQWSECNKDTNEMTRTRQLKKPKSASTCAPTKTDTKTCSEKCKYMKVAWGDCENGKKTRTMNLKQNSGSGCPPTKTQTKNC